MTIPTYIMLAFTAFHLNATAVVQLKRNPDIIINCIQIISADKIETVDVAEKILLITVNETGIIKVNGDPVGSDFLASYIQERLFKSYLGTGKMHSGIKLVKFNNQVPDMVTEVVTNEIKEGQRKALVQVCLLRYNKLFNSLETKKKEKMQKLFPVLFQTDYQ